MKTVETMQDMENVSRRLSNAHKLLRGAVITLSNQKRKHELHFDGVIEDVQGNLKRGYAIAIEGGTKYAYTGSAKAIEVLDYNQNTLYVDLLNDGESTVEIPFGAKYIRPIF